MGDWVILFRKNLFSRPNLLSSKMIAIFGVYIKTVSSMQNLTLELFANSFSPKSLSLFLKNHTNVP